MLGDNFQLYNREFDTLIYVIRMFDIKGDYFHTIWATEDGAVHTQDYTPAQMVQEIDRLEVSYIQ